MKCQDRSSVQRIAYIVLREKPTRNAGVKYQAFLSLEPPKCKTSGAKYAAGKASGWGVEFGYDEDTWVYGDMDHLWDMAARGYARMG